jgi:hypothetical protein
MLLTFVRNNAVAGNSDVYRIMSHLLVSWAESILLSVEGQTFLLEIRGDSYAPNSTILV